MISPSLTLLHIPFLRTQSFSLWLPSPFCRQDSDSDWAPEIQGAANVEKSEEEALKVLLQPNFVKETPPEPLASTATFEIFFFSVLHVKVSDSF